MSEGGVCVCGHIQVANLLGHASQNALSGISKMVLEKGSTIVFSGGKTRAIC
ncbi:MAG: hypothetical protein WKF36_09610 [Candidatus Nitrosocosmicus sp.]